MTTQANLNNISEQNAYFLHRNDIINRYGNAISSYLTLPGLIGFWPMATVQLSTGNVPNYAPTYTGATKQDMVYNGNPTFNYHNGIVPYIDLDGTGDFLNVADNADIDVIGTETQYTNPGLTVGCWFNGDTLQNLLNALITKGDDTNTNVAWYMSWDVGNTVLFAITTGGTSATVTSVLSPSNSAVAGGWVFAVGRWIPSTEMKVWANTFTNTNTTSIPAAIYNSSAALTIGEFATTPVGLYDGQITFCFMCTTALSDAMVNLLFQQTRALFGV